MKVYPVNALETAAITSAQKKPYSKFEELFNRYIDYQVDFNEMDIQLTGIWNDSIPVDVFLIGNTNAKTGNIIFKNKHNIVFQKNFNASHFINIVEIIDNTNRLQLTEIDEFVLTLYGNNLIQIGLIYIGETWILPRFIVNPKTQIVLRNEAGKTFSGQVMGIPVETLRTFATEYIRISNEDRFLLDNYINGVQMVIPHVIDPYPEAHDQFPAFFATVTNYSVTEKRDENGFFWNLGISWEEAK
jgi:hypothetical protein